MRAFVVGVLLLAGCPSRAKENEAAIEQMSEFAETACACKDTACAQMVQTNVVRWTTMMANKEKAKSKEPRATAAEMKRMKAVVDKYTACVEPWLPKPRAE